MSTGFADPWEHETCGKQCPADLLTRYVRVAHANLLNLLQESKDSCHLKLPSSKST